MLVSIPVPLALAQQDAMRGLNRRMHPALEIDESRVRAAGIAKRSGKFIDLYTDLRDEAQVTELVQVFDAAVPAWAEYFGVAADKVNLYRISGIVIQQGNEQRFRDAGLLPAELPGFAAGYNRGHEFWIYTQPGDYYTRHLMLHEGTHAFMQWMLGGSGPPWYSEGMAELLAVHAWQQGKLTLGLERSSRAGTAYWGRPKIIREDVASGHPRSLEQVLATPNINFRQVRYYAWAWAACRFLSHHPASQDVFRGMAKHANQVGEPFNVQLRAALKPVREQLDRDWLLYIQEMDYGYDIRAAALGPARKTSDRQFEVDAARGWQTTDVSLRTGQKLQIECGGRIQVRETTKPWVSEVPGITIEYYQGRPLGQLLVGVLVDGAVDRVQTLTADGRGTYPVPVDGQLVLRVNESPAGLHDNHSHFTASVSVTE